MSFSEIPSNWIKPKPNTKNKATCWWPVTKNVSSLIEHRTEPNTQQWNSFDIKIIKYCSSLATARKAAANANYTTTEEDGQLLGRGQRKFRNNYLESNSEEEQETDDDEEEASQNKENSQKLISKKKIIKHAKRTINKSTFLTSMPVYSNIINPPKILATAKNSESVSDNEMRIEDSAALLKTNDDQPVEIISKQPDTVTMNPVLDLNLENVPIIDIAHGNDICQMLQRIEDKLDKILRTEVSVKSELRNISHRLTNLEVLRGPVETVDNDNADVITELLPLSNIDNIKMFENFIKPNEVATSQFKKIIMKIGGNTPRLTIHRTLERVFTNKCALDCSWKGVRANFRVCDLHFMKMIKNSVCSTYSTLTEAEFEATAAEWFRFAKQRAAREEKRSNLQQLPAPVDQENN
ncbi:uncharacterized protein LOC118644834 [Monomorium pharaonis]|uniref:uncharacterized protein LOC118644834 n=1 Tax=Monomorium pharaonis TaxID=307658 RepID=UPI001745CC57|nr:uncharacterized protein LOC118644834 [Monomorium pharaonis]